MPETLLFVHGINVRGEAYFRSLDLVGRKVQTFLPGVNLEGCQWGDPFGARLRKNGASIPGYDATGDAQPAVDDAARALWFLLSQDPLLELRVLPQEKAVGDRSGVWIWKQFPAVASNQKVLALLSDCGVEKEWPAFVNSILADKTWESVVTSITEGRAAVSARVARAVTAAFQIYLRERALPGLFGAQRDRLQQDLLQPFGGPPLAVKDWFLERFVHAGGYYGRRHRGHVSDLTSPAVGDILVYQARGGLIRNFIGEQVQKHSATMILAHSLGGVAAVDWLAGEQRPVKRLFTVGSQAPYFYEIDALVSRSFGEGLPGVFPKTWLNFFDQSDLLSYQGNGVFPGQIEDFEVQSRQPFPESHSAYFQNDEQVWKKIAEFLSRDSTTASAKQVQGQ